jgi:hypothetical protein
MTNVSGPYFVPTRPNRFHSLYVLWKKYPVRCVAAAVALIVLLVVLFVVFTSGGTPTASSVVSGDGYTVQPNSAAGITNTNPNYVASEAWGTQGNTTTGSAELVLVLTPQGQQAEQQVLSTEQATFAGAGLSTSYSNGIVRVTGPDSAWESIGANGGL